jgi:hypothetical protein
MVALARLVHKRKHVGRAARVTSLELRTIVQSNRLLRGGERKGN